MITHAKLFYRFSSPSLKTYYGGMKRRLREMQEFNVIKADVDDLTYFKQMKLFNEEVRGLPVNSEKYRLIRDKHHNILHEIAANTPRETQQVTSFEESYLKFYLVVIPEDPKCYSVLSVLNNNKIRYKAVIY